MLRQVPPILIHFSPVEVIQQGIFFSLSQNISILSYLGSYLKLLGHLSLDRYFVEQVNMLFQGVAFGWMKKFHYFCAPLLSQGGGV